MFMEVLGIIIIIIVLILVMSSSGNKRNRIDTKTEKLLKELNADRKNEKANKDARYKQIYKDECSRHKFKTLDEIDAFVKQKRDDDYNYWGRNTIEYKVLMEMQRKLLNEEFEKIKADIIDCKYENFTISECIEYLSKIRMYNFVIDTDAKDKFIKHIEKTTHNILDYEIKDMSDKTKLIWLNARKREGRYVPDSIIEKVKNETVKEDDEASLIRERKNIMNNIGRNTENDIRTEYFKKLLDENTEQLKKYKDKKYIN